MSASLETHSSFLRFSFWRSVERVFPEWGALPPVTVAVQSGLHDGAEATFRGRTVTIGPDPDFDVMLIDEDIADGWAILTFEKSVFGPLVTVEPHHDEVVLDEAKLTSFEPSPPVRLPCEVRIGSVDLRIASDGAPYRGPFAWVAALVAPLLVAAGIGALGFLQVREYMERAPVELMAFEDETSPSEDRPEVGIGDAATEILDERGFGDLLRTVADGTNRTLAISGTIPASMMPQWRAALSEIDAKMPDEVVITDVVAAHAISDLPAIVAVRLDDEPSVILASGFQVGLGEAIKDDWIVAAITAEAMTLRRNTETVEVTF